MSQISELMARDPLKLTKPDLAEIVAHFRENRARYVAGVKTPKEKKPIPEGGLNLSDLELDL